MTETGKLMRIRARYEDGVFRPLEKIRVAEGTVVEIYLPAEQKSHASVKNLPLAGMWKERTDIKDGLTYVDGVRGSARYRAS